MIGNNHGNQIIRLFRPSLEMWEIDCRLMSHGWMDMAPTLRAFQ